MCFFITLVVQTGDVASVRALMESHGRTATAIDNPSMRKVLRDGERSFLTTIEQCDCASVLAARLGAVADDADAVLAKDIDRMRRKGWSEAKIARATKDRSKVKARPRRGHSDSLELWAAALASLQREMKLAYAGLCVGEYAGSPETGSSNISRREAARGVPLLETLSSIKQDELTIIHLR